MESFPEENCICDQEKIWFYSEKMKTFGHLHDDK